MPDHEHGTILDAIRDAVDVSEHADKEPGRRMVAIVHEVIEAACTVAEALESPGENVNELVEAAEGLFDEFVVPIDIPGVPDWLEGPAEQVIRMAIAPAIRGFVGSLTRP